MRSSWDIDGGAAERRHAQLRAPAGLGMAQQALQPHRGDRALAAQSEDRCGSLPVTPRNHPTVGAD